MHGRSHAVECLPVHTDGGQRVQYEENAFLETILQEQKDSKLTQFFANNQKEADDRNIF